MPTCTCCGEVIEDLDPISDDLCEDCFDAYNSEDRLFDDLEEELDD